MLDRTYRLNPSQPDQVHRSRPKARLRTEILDSMPARKERDHLFRCGDLLSLEDPPVGLIDDFCEDTHCPFEPSGQFSSCEGVGKGMSFIGGKLGDCFFAVSYHKPGILEEVPVCALTYRVFPCIEDRHDPPVIAELIPGSSFPSVSHRVITRMPSARSVESVG